VIEALKSAFVDGRLTKDELAARTGRALKARTYADLAALTADLPAGPAVAGSAAVEPLPPVPATVKAAPAEPPVAEPPVAEPPVAEPAPAGPAGPPKRVIRRPLVKSAAVSGLLLVFAAAALRLSFPLDPETAGSHPYHSLGGALFFLAFYAAIAAVLALALGVAISLSQRRSRRQLPPSPGPGRRALDGGQPGGAGRDPVPPGHRTDETQTDLRADKPRRRGRRGIARPTGVPGGVRPAPGAA
jgi:hypothetical protein